jgi:hypothetical protein
MAAWDIARSVATKPAGIDSMHSAPWDSIDISNNFWQKVRAGHQKVGTSWSEAKARCFSRLIVDGRRLAMAWWIFLEGEVGRRCPASQAVMEQDPDQERVRMMGGTADVDRLISLIEVGHRFHMRRAGAGALTRPPPIGHGLYVAAGLGAVMGQQFRLPLGDLGKTLHQRLGDLRMVLLPRALE